MIILEELQLSFEILHRLLLHRYFKGNIIQYTYILTSDHMNKSNMYSCDYFRSGKCCAVLIVKNDVKIDVPFILKVALLLTTDTNVAGW